VKQCERQYQSVDWYSTSLIDSSPFIALGSLVLCEQNFLQQVPESSLGGFPVADRVRKTVPGGHTMQDAAMAEAQWPYVLSR